MIVAVVAAAAVADITIVAAVAAATADAMVARAAVVMTRLLLPKPLLLLRPRPLPLPLPLRPPPSNFGTLVISRHLPESAALLAPAGAMDGSQRPLLTHEKRFFFRAGGNVLGLRFQPDALSLVTRAIPRRSR